MELLTEARSSTAAVPDADAQLMSAVQEGSSDSFELLVFKYRSPVLNYVCRMVQDSAAAEDLTQDVFLRVYRSRQYYEPRAKFSTWLFRIATNVALNYRRDRRHESGGVSIDRSLDGSGRAFELTDQATTAEQDLVAEARVLEIRRAIHRLPEKQRAAVLLHKYSGFEYVEIARALNTTVPAVKSLLFRAYGTLRRTLRA